jgi:primosomal protein N' (replication factor Y) (superfamily II helicase)
MTSPRFIEVALPLPLFQTFTYTVADGPLPAAGSRVLVPVRNRRAIGIVLGPTDGAGVARPRAIIEALDAEPVLSAALLALCTWMSEYYVVPLGLVMRSVLPVLLTVERAPTPSARTIRVATIARELPSLQERDKFFRRTPRQRALYEVLEQMGGRGEVPHLTTQLGFGAELVRALATRGLVTIETSVVARDPFLARARIAATPHEPSAAQRAAIEALVAGKGGDVFLLHGVTGSGKTLVYIELLREIVMKRLQSAIVLVPEIALTPQTVDRFRAVFGDQVAVLHSALSDGERYDAYLALRRGEKRIAVGARSAIFAPLANLGAIIVDEEHEGSYKNGETPRYHAREVAMVRARAEGAVVVLGSATPSLESWENAAQGKYTLLSLPERVGAARLPSVEVVDLRHTQRPVSSEQQLDPSRVPFRFVFSEPLEAALGERLQRGEQSILLLNRRGYASFLQCEACGTVRSCPNCSITLTYHRSPERLICHYCLHEEMPETVCRKCGGTTIRQRGLGTQQVERLIAERYPYARIARMDVDTTSGKWAHAEILDRVGRGEVEILLGTQMIAKGLDFPNVTLVGVIDADIGINLPDFRASERSFQLLSQVAGRAGRGPKGGEVIIQTRVPTHHAVQCAVTHDYLAFVRQESPARRDPLYPPAIRLANVIFSGVSEKATADLALDAAEWLRKLLSSHAIAEVTLVGPAPCPVDRIKKRWRWHLLLKSQRASALSKVGGYFLERFTVPSSHGLRVAFDRDPVSLL